jgi:hypothetical protein
VTDTTNGAPREIARTITKRDLERVERL